MLQTTTRRSVLQSLFCVGHSGRSFDFVTSSLYWYVRFDIHGILESVNYVSSIDTIVQPFEDVAPFVWLTRYSHNDLRSSSIVRHRNFNQEQIDDGNF